MKVICRRARLAGTIPAIPSKSHAHRVLLAASLCREETAVRLTLLSEDLQATLSCVRGLGGTVRQEGDSLTILPASAPASRMFDCGESGTTLRFFLPVAAVDGGGDFTGRGRLPARPLEDLRQALEAHGISFSAPALPFSLTGNLRAGEYRLPGNVSSQYLSGLLFALPMLSSDSTLLLSSPLCSAGYLEMTLRVLETFGIQIESREGGFFIPGGQTYRSPGEVAIEGDWSNAAFWETARFLGSPLTVTGLCESSVQRDKEICPILDAMKQSGELTVDASDIPDLVPVLCVAAAARTSQTVFSGTARLRMKESDRVESVCRMINALGGTISAGENAITVMGTGGLRGGTVESAGDHRIAMSAAIAALCCREPVTVLGAEAVAKSYPTFWEDYQKQGGICDGVELR